MGHVRKQHGFQRAGGNRHGRRSGHRKRGAGHIAIVDVSAVDLSEGAKKLQEAGFSVSTHQVDVTNLAQVQGCVQSVLTKYGKVDVVVQAAGITGKTNVITEDVDPANF